MSRADRFSQVNLTKQKPKPESQIEQRLGILNRNFLSIRTGPDRLLNVSFNKTMTQTQEITLKAKMTQS
jgi:hypothetical protein